MEILNVTGSVLQYLRDKIIIGELKSGQKLNENVLSSSLGISRPPLREVFRMLEKDHMVINIPRKGTYVVELSVKDYEELSQIREMMECYAIDLLKASNIRDLPKVTLALNKALSLPMSINSVDPEELLNRIRVILNFHSSLVESAGNSRLAYTYHSVSLNLARYQFIYFYVSGAVQHSMDDHAKTLEFIRDGNYDQAKEELRKHIHYTVGLVRKRILHPVVSDAESVPF
jgi:DNA-binding GntR family transcriptional regulator